MDIPSNNIWLVVEKSSMKNMSSSIGMDDSSQDIWKKKHVPNHQQDCKSVFLRAEELSETAR